MQNRKLKRTGMMMALAIGIHNFPEGLATFASALSDMEIAIPIVFAIAIHNIPEGIAVSVSIYHATGNRRKAFWLSFLSCSFSRFGRPVSMPCCWHLFPASWFIFRSTNCCPEPKNTGITITELRA